MEQWIECYNLSVVETRGVLDSSMHLAGSTASIVASTLPRSLSSVDALGYTPSMIDPVFCEAGLPFSHLRFPRLPPFIWAAIFRMLWLLGYSHGSESLHDAQYRATEAAKKLTDLNKKGTVLLMGHGIMNRLIGNQLVRWGWSGSKPQKSKYWSAIVYKI
jgi:hypothetical protein